MKNSELETCVASHSLPEPANYPKKVGNHPICLGHEGMLEDTLPLHEKKGETADGPTRGTRRLEVDWRTNVMLPSLPPSCKGKLKEPSYF